MFARAIHTRAKAPSRFLPVWIALVALAFVSVACPDASAFPAPGRVFAVANWTSASVTLYDWTAVGDAAPLRTISGPATGISGLNGVCIHQDLLYVACHLNGSVRVFNVTDSGNVAPVRVLSGPATGISMPVRVLAHDGELFVTNYAGRTQVFNLGDSGDTAPKRTLNTIASPYGVAVYGDEIFLTRHPDTGDANRIYVFDLTASGSPASKRTIFGPSTGLSFAGGIFVYEGEIYVGNDFSSSITVYGVNDSGDMAPRRTIQGGATGLGGPLDLFVADGEIFAVNRYVNTVTVFNTTDSGNVAPKRLIAGASTGLSGPMGIGPQDTEPPSVTWDFEDGTTGDWGIASHPNLTILRNVVDADRNGDVIELKANTLDTWFCMGGPGGADLNETNTVAQWSLKSEGFFYFYVEVDTTGGPRTLYYTSVGEDKLAEGAYIHHGLAYANTYGQWCTYLRDLDADLKDAEPGNSVTAVNRFCVRGTNMRLDDLSLLAAIPADFDSDNDGLMDLEERNTYATGLYDADSDDDGVNDGPEVAAWALLGQSWDANPDGDGDVNLLDADSDNDGFDDGTEIAAGSDPADANSIPPVSYDWNDGGISGWTVASGLGLVRNVARDAGRAIELRGSTSTTFSLKNADNTLWHDNVHDSLSWDMKASSMYYLMVDLQTANGHRTLLYTPSDADLGLSGEYLRFGLGVVSKNGAWQTHNRNLAADVSAAEPGNTILEVNQILYKGPGFFDNVQLSGGL